MADGHLLIMGHHGETYGFMVFSERADFELFVACGRGLLKSSELVLPKCYSLNYEPIEPELIGADPKHGPLPLPLLTVFERDMQRPPSPSEAKLLIATAIGLSRFAKRHGSKIARRPNRRAGISGRYRVEVLGERLEVRLSARDTRH